MYLTNAGSVAFSAASGGSPSFFASGGKYNDGQWHLADAVVTSTGATVYVDGDRDITVKNNGSVGSNQTGYWRVGYDDLSNQGNHAPNSDYLAGSIDEVAIYNTALTAQQVKDHYCAS
jgi:hypothetical protein